MNLDLHIHSTYSRDGTASPEDIIRRCTHAGLSGCAITDHNAIGGSLKAHSFARNQSLVIVRGVEVSAQEGHVLAYGVNELIPRGLAVEETVIRIRDAGGIAVAPHPHRFPSGIGIGLAREHDFDAIEILNGGSSARSNALARSIAESRRSPVTGGSDAHTIDQVGKAFTVLDSASSEEEVIEAVRKGMARVGGRSRSRREGLAYSVETFIEWVKGDLRRL